LEKRDRFLLATTPSTLHGLCSLHGNTVSFVLANGKEAYGKTSGIILNDGKQFVGRLGKVL
jgi:hypothetical protein